uniref:Putative primase n=1 Tax=viral metagenome TaxID=1070528 RepID=A0A6M3IG20_9ZZZZ
MAELNEVLSRLKGVKKVGNEYLAFCPAHEDRSNRSLEVTERDGKLLMHCFCGCSYGEILKSLNIDTPTKEAPVIEAVYDYTDEDGNLLYQVIRYYPKKFLQRHFENGNEVWNLKGVERVLFNLPKVINSTANGETLYFCEGEKDAINLGQYVTTTTISGGASSSWLPQYSKVLKDAIIAVLPDNDTPGQRYAETIADQIYGWAKEVKVLKLGSKDVTEWLKTHNHDELQVLWEQSPQYIPEHAVTREEFNGLKRHIIFMEKTYSHPLSYKKKYVY